MTTLTGRAVALALALAAATVHAQAPTSGCDSKPATACMPGVPERLAKPLARNAPALRMLLSWLARNEAQFGSDENPSRVAEARRDEVLRELWYEHLGGKLEPGPLSLDRMELLATEVLKGAAQRGEDNAAPWLLVCRQGTAWPVVKTQAHATRPCVALQAAAGQGAGWLVLEFGDYAQAQQPWTAGQAPWLARKDFEVIMSLADGHTLAQGEPREGGAVAGLPYEAEDWGVPATRALRAENIHAPTPAAIPGARVITTAALFKLMMNDGPPPLILDVVPVKWRRTVPSALQLPNAGMLATEAKNGALAGEINETLRSRLAHVLAQETGGDKARPVVILCTGVDCWLSYNASLRAVAEGYTNVLWYRGGTAGWREAGLPWDFPRRIQFNDGPRAWEQE